MFAWWNGGVSLERADALVYRVIEITSSSVRADELLTGVSELVRDGLGLDVCLVYLWDQDQRVLTAHGALGDGMTLEGVGALQLGECAAGWAAEHRTTVVIPRGASADPRYRPLRSGTPCAGLMCVPLVSRTGALIGVMEIRSRNEGRFGPDEVRTLEATARLLSGGIEASHLLRESGEKGEALAALMRQTIAVQEEERRRVATEIHDGVTQQLVSIWFRVHACQRLLEREAVEEARGEIMATKRLIDETLVDARAAIYNLRPATLDDLGLVAALNELSTRFTAECGVRVGIDAPEEVHLSPHLETTMYRIAQEALANVRKHARARSVMLTLRGTSEGTELCVVDDGQGFDVERFLNSRSTTSFGLAGMRERVGSVGGRFTFRSAVGEGTTLRVTVPMDQDALEMLTP